MTGSPMSDCIHLPVLGSREGLWHIFGQWHRKVVTRHHRRSFNQPILVSALILDLLLCEVLYFLVVQTILSHSFLLFAPGYSVLFPMLDLKLLEFRNCIYLHSSPFKAWNTADPKKMIVKFNYRFLSIFSDINSPDPISLVKLRARCLEVFFQVTRHMDIQIRKNYFFHVSFQDVGLFREYTQLASLLCHWPEMYPQAYP